ncbi:MAG: hypothetical protein HON54_13300 [Verrucomicrobia bacterium]|nr:hypothetical protein [Verrucomicrobiota bacterium]
MIAKEHQRLLGKNDGAIGLARHGPGQGLRERPAKLGAGRVGATLGFPLTELGQSLPDLPHVRGGERAECVIKNRPSEREGNLDHRADGFWFILGGCFFSLIGNDRCVVEMHHGHLDGVRCLDTVVGVVSTLVFVLREQPAAARHNEKDRLAAQLEGALGTQRRAAQEQRPQYQSGFLRRHARVSQPNPCQM